MRGVSLFCRKIGRIFGLEGVYMRNMRIRIQPVAVEVPEDEPFKHDLLNRKEPAEILTSLIESVEGSCVIGIDAPWGRGKTTFLKMWAQHMHNEGFPVVEFNAWETDFAQDPFIALSSELQQSLNAYFSEDDSGDASPRFDEKKMEQFQKNVSQVTVQLLNQKQISNQLIVHGNLQLFGESLDQSTVRSAIQKANKLKGGQADHQSSIEQNMQGQNISEQTTQECEKPKPIAYQDTGEALKALRVSLEAVVAQSLDYDSTRPSDNASQSGEPDSSSQLEDLDSQSEDTDRHSEKRKPLVVFIDELDRCRPTYAIEVLEIAKHLFAVDGVVFVLGVNRSELAESVKAVYGASFNAEGYLHRFFDLDIRLPSPNREAFIESQLKAIRLDVFLARTKDKHASSDYGEAKDLLLAFFDSSTLSLRDVEQAIRRLGVVLKLMRSEQWSFIMSAVVLMILRTIDRNAYYDLISGKASDRQIIERVFDIPSMNALRNDSDQYQNEGLTFEAMIIIGCAELKDTQDHRVTLDSIKSESEMCKYCLDIINSRESAVGTTEQEAGESAGSTPAETTNRPSTYTDEEVRHAQKLIKHVEHIHSCMIYRNTMRAVTGKVLGFGHTIKRLELVWADSSDH